MTITMRRPIRTCLLALVAPFAVGGAPAWPVPDGGPDRVDACTSARANEDAVLVEAADAPAPQPKAQPGDAASDKESGAPPSGSAEKVRRALYERKPLVDTDVFKLELEGQLQVKFLRDQGTRVENGSYYTHPVSQGFDGSPGSDRAPRANSFSIRRARIALLGSFLYPWIKYLIQTDLIGTTEPDTKRKVAELRNAYVEFTKNPAAQLRVGQFKAPFSYEQMTSGKYLQFTERGLADELLQGNGELNDKGDVNKTRGVVNPVQLSGYDLGAMISGTDKGKRYGYEIGAFNGNGRNRDVNNDTHFQYNFRFHYDNEGGYKLDETAVANPGKPEYTVGLAYVQNTDNGNDITGLEMFGGWRLHRFAVHGAWYRLDNGDNHLKTSIATAQAGYFIRPEKIEIVARGAVVGRDDYRANLDRDPLLETETAQAFEARVGVNYYLEAHHLKFLFDAGKVVTKLDVKNDAAGDADTFNGLSGRRKITSAQVRGMLAMFF